MKIVFIQTLLELGKWAKNVDYASVQVRAVIRDHSPNLILLLKTFPGYMDPNGEPSSEPDNGKTLSRMIEVTEEAECLVLFGILRSTPEGRFNSAILASGTGVLGVYDETHLVSDRDRPEFDEQEHFVAGGRLGIFDCGS